MSGIHHGGIVVVEFSGFAVGFATNHRAILNFPLDREDRARIGRGWLEHTPAFGVSHPSLLLLPPPPSSPRGQWTHAGMHTGKRAAAADRNRTLIGRSFCTLCGQACSGRVRGRADGAAAASCLARQLPSQSAILGVGIDCAPTAGPSRCRETRHPGRWIELRARKHVNSTPPPPGRHLRREAETRPNAAAPMQQTKRITVYHEVPASTPS